MTAPNHAETSALTVVDQTAPYQTSSLMLNPQLMTQMMAVAEAMSEATITVPAHFRGKPGDCLAVVMQATQWNMNPFAVAQKTHVVNGTLGYEAQLVHAVLQATGAIDGTFSYEYRGTGNALECRVGAVCKGSSELTWGEWLSIANVTTKNSPLWKTNQPQQMGYLQVKNWARAFKPGAILGVYITDELLAAQPEKHMGPADVVGAPPPPPAPEHWPDELFKQRLPEWHKAIKDKKATADAIVAKARTKHPLTPEQEAAVREMKAEATDAAVKFTYAQVAERITKAADADALAIARDLIPAVTDEGQRAELQAKADARETELKE